MNSRVLSYIAFGVCVFLGTLFLGLRHHALDARRTAEEESLWSLTYDIDFEPVEAGAEVFVSLPIDTPHCQVKVGKPSNPGLRSETRGGSLVATAPQSGGPYNIREEVELRLSPLPDASRSPAMEYLSERTRERLTRPGEGIPSQGKIVRDVAQQALDKGDTISEQVQWIFRYCSDIAPGVADDPESILSQANPNASPLGRARTMAALCRAIQIPARLVAGFEIKQELDAKPLVWVEVFQNQLWLPYDPGHGFTRYMPPTFVPVRRGGDQIVRPSGASTAKATYSIVRVDPPKSVLQAELKHPKQILNLKRLPVPMQPVMSILLLLPFGALITAIVRNVVGIGTFGTFSPALLAMSFIYADWETGLAILIVVLVAGVSSRTFLERLRLLAVPRLSIILTVVIMCIVFGVSLLDYLELTPSAQAVLLPMVILTMLIERFYVTTEEDGLVYTLQLAGGTLLVATSIYAVLAWDSVGQFVLVYPEVHFFTIAVFIMLGRYAGYRITELWRFRDLVTLSENP